MLLDHNNIVIFSPPRSGTKLLSKILEDANYHVHGEWFSLRTTYIDDNKAIRREEYLEYVISDSEREFRNSVAHYTRLKQYNKVDKSVITIWPEALTEFPFLAKEFKDYHWACIRRNAWDQMLSYYITSTNSNYDSLTNSKATTFQEGAFRKIYWNYHSACHLQEWLVENKSATLIDFNALISGNAKEIGQNYQVNSKDEHVDLESLVVNLAHVKHWFNKFEKTRLEYMST
jgi:hypothetical protein